MLAVLDDLGGREGRCRSTASGVTFGRRDVEPPVVEDGGCVDGRCPGC